MEFLHTLAFVVAGLVLLADVLDPADFFDPPRFTRLVLSGLVVLLAGGFVILGAMLEDAVSTQGYVAPSLLARCLAVGVTAILLGALFAAFAHFQSPRIGVALCGLIAAPCFLWTLSRVSRLPET